MAESSDASRSFVQGFAHALRGIAFGWRTQRNLRVHACATVTVIALGFAFQIERWEWCVVFLACGSVWSAELLNTAIECLADRVSKEREEAIRVVKDAAAGAVLAASIAAAVVGGIVFLPRFLP